MTEHGLRAMLRADAVRVALGGERLEAVVRDGAQLPTERAADAILASVDAWSGLPAADDLTVLLVDHAG